MVEREKRPVVVLSGGRTTRPLAAPLDEDYDVAIYDPNSLGFFREKVDHVICPAKGATQALHENAFNVAAIQAAKIVAEMDRVKERLGDHAEGWLPGLSTSVMASVVMNMTVLDAFAKEFDVRLVVTHEDVTPIYRALVLWARARGVPSLHIPHANHFLIDGIRDVHERCLADRIAAASPWMARWYAGRGYPEERIALTGCPNWDRWSRLDLAREEARAVLRVSQDATVVTYCTSWPQNTNYVDDHDVWRASHDAVLAAAAEEGWTLIWSQHPGSPPEWRKQFAMMMKNHGLEDGMIVRGHLDLTARASDCFVAVGPSNVVIEAALGGAPSATIGIQGYGFPSIPPAHARPMPASVMGAVAEAMAFDGEQMAWFVEEYALANDGCSTDRVVALVREMAGDA